MEVTWEKRYYKPGDEKRIQELFKYVFHREMGKTESREHWHWEFIKNPSGKGEILLALDKGKIVGHYAVIPEIMKVKDSRLTATLSLDTMVHPSYQGQRIFTLLASSLYKDIREKGMPLTYGFPNKNSIHGIVKKLQWQEITALPLLHFTVGSEKVLSKALKSKFASKIGSLFFGKKHLTNMPKSSGQDWTIEKISTFDQEYDEIFDQGSEGIDVILVRNSRYLNWRFIQKPENDYECFVISQLGQKYGYIVLKKEKKFDINSAFVVDYFSRGNDTWLDTILISWATDYLNFSGMDIIVVVMFSHLPYYKIFKKKGYFRLPRKMFPKDIFFCARNNSEHADFDLIFKPTSWYLTWGDTDVV